MSIVDLLAGRGRGPLWGDATEDLNLTLRAWPPGDRRRGGLEIGQVEAQAGR